MKRPVQAAMSGLDGFLTANRQTLTGSSAVRRFCSELSEQIAEGTHPVLVLLEAPDVDRLDHPEQSELENDYGFDDDDAVARPTVSVEDMKPPGEEHRAQHRNREKGVAPGEAFALVLSESGIEGVVHDDGDDAAEHRESRYAVGFP